MEVGLELPMSETYLTTVTLPLPSHPQHKLTKNGEKHTENVSMVFGKVKCLYIVNLHPIHFIRLAAGIIGLDNPHVLY